MQSGSTRRVGKTYGKANKSAFVHDLFDCRSSHSGVSTATSSRQTDPSTPRQISNATDPDPSKDAKTIPPKTVSYLSSFDVSEKQIASELRNSLIQDTSVFDLESSNDDNGTSSDTSGSRASKRRRIERSFVEQKGNKNKLNIPERPIDENDILLRAQPKITHKTKLEPLRKPKTLAKSGRLQAPSGTKKPPLPQQNQQQEKAQMLRTLNNVHIQDIAPLRSSVDITLPRHRSITHNSKSLLSAPRSAVSNPRKPLKSTTLLLSDSDSDVSSPSRLSMTSLKLREPSPVSIHLSPKAVDHANAESQNNRQRLIDRLDTPDMSAGLSSEDQVSDPGASSPAPSQKANNLPAKMSNTKHRIRQPQQSDPMSTGVQKPELRNERAVRPRTTYATQRSHLSDMMDGFDNLDDQMSQKSIHERAIHIPLSNVGSQLELDDDSDEPSGGGKLKSIHELRQAGANNRSDREIDVLLDDMSSGPTSSKAARVQALMKLLVKLKEPAFNQYFVREGKIQRLLNLAGSPADLPTNILLMQVFLATLDAEAMSVETLAHLLKAAADICPDMLNESRPMSKIARDRKQNFSKITINELAEFEARVSSVDHPVPLENFQPDMIALVCLQRILQQMAQNGITSARLSTSVYVAILELLQSEVQGLNVDNKETKILHKIKTTLSLLELCAVMVDESVLHIGDDHYKALGDAVAMIVQKIASLSLDKSLKISALRLVVSLSNNKPRMCRLLSQSDICKSAFGIIDSDFLSLIRQAEAGSPIDESKLDGIVLALGCLLNFADCDHISRTHLLRIGKNDLGVVQRLTAIFKSQASKVDEAMTEEQSQISVAFGYLSMLLCTLSLEPGPRIQISAILNDTSLESLCTVAEKFLGHLRTLATLSQDDTSVNGFAARFGSILESIRDYRW